MSHRTWPGKHFLLLLSFLVAVLSCQKPDTEEETPGEEIPPPTNTAVFESLFESPVKSFCGETYTSDLKVKKGDNVGSVTVGNDDTYLYLTYNLEHNWYLVNVQTYAGAKDLIPRTGSGNPNHGQFPGKQEVTPCDLRQTFTFRVALSSITTESTTDCAGRYFVAMRAAIRHIPNAAACSTGEDLEAWAAPILINPGRQEEWATAFFYCKQDCPPPPPPAPTWCAFGQGYWFASGKKDWCNGDEVTFGSLKVSKTAGFELWSHPGKRSVQEKAFFQAAALQLSLHCKNGGRPMPEDIKDDYDVIAAMLATYTDLQDLNNDSKLTDEQLQALQDAAGTIGKWICEHNCNREEDPTACTQ